MKNLIKNKSTKKATKNNNNFITPSYITRAGSLLNGVVDGGMAKQGFYDTESSIPNFYTPELTPDTWLLPRSRAEIIRWPLLEGEKVWCNGKFVNIEDIKIGDKVLASNGKEQTVLNTMSKEADDVGVEIITRFAPPVQFGGNHPIWAVDTNKSTEYISKCFRTCLYNNAISFDTVAKWYDAKDVKPGFMVKIPKYKKEKEIQIDLADYLPEETSHGYRFNVLEGTINYKLGQTDQNIKRFLPLNKDVFEFLGWYVAEGHIHKNTVILTLANDELSIANYLKEVIVHNFDISEDCIHIIPHNGSYRLCINNPVLASFILNNFNTGSKDKVIPQWLLEHKKEHVISFLRGWIKGDGKITDEALEDQTSGFSLTTTSEQLSKMGYMLFNKVGCIVGVKEVHQTLAEAQKKAGFKYTIQSCAPVVYYLTANGNRVKNIFPELTYTEKVCPNFYEDEDYYYTTVKSVKIFETTKRFHCVTTEDHTICVPYITHNCRLFFNLDPYINSILTMHAQYPICNFRLSYKDKDTEEFFNRKLFFNKEFSWIDFLEQLMLSYLKLGEAVIWGDFSEANGTWTNFTLIDPALINYKEDPMSGEVEMSIIPTRELKEMIADALKQGRQDVPIEYIKCVQENHEIPLDASEVEANYLTGRKYSPARVFMMARRTDPASTRGVPMIQCARYNTKIKLLDGTIKTIGELFDSKAKNFYVYSVDEKGNIVPKKATKVIYRGKKQTYDVLLDNGEVLGFTADHPFLMRDGSWKEVKDLKPGDSLMPLYVRDSKIGNGYYEQVYNPNKDKWEFTHRLVELDGKFKGCVIHHKNFNKKDNRPENLQVLSFKDHVKYHQELIEQSREKLNESLKKYRTTDKFKENCKKQSLWASKAVAEYWKDPAYRQKQAEYKEKRAEGVRNAYLTTDLHNKIQEGHNRFLKDYYKNDILFDKIVSLKDGYIITDGGKETGNHYKRLIQTLGLPLKVVSENNKTVIFSANIDIKEVISKELINIRSSFYNSVIQKIKDAFNQKVDYIILDNEEFNLTDRNKSSTLKKALHKYGIDLEVSMLKGFGSTIIYKKSDKDVASLFKRNSESIEYSKVSKDRALNALDCESVVNELMYSKNPTQKILDFNKSHIRQLRAYINRLNLPITVNKCNNNIVLNRIWNHKVVSVTPSIVEDVYDIECVDGTHNFAVACSDGSGVFVHNCLFKSLIYSDKIKLAQVATADRLHLPIEIWSVGQYTGDPNTSIIPDDTMLANVREAIREATMQPPFSIFVPPYIKYEAVGVNGKLLSVYEDLGYVENCIFVALGVNKNLILGQGPSFSSSKQTSLFKLIKMYKMMRLKLEAFIKRYIILPIAKANDIKDEYGEYVVPEIEWEESLQPEQDVEMFNNVLKLWDKGLVSTMTLYEYFPGQLDINLEKKRMEEEKRSVFDKGTDRLGAKSLREDLKEDSPESKSTPKPSDGKGPAKDMPSPISGGEALEGLEKGEEETPPAGGSEPTPPTSPEGLEGE